MKRLALAGMLAFVSTYAQVPFARRDFEAISDSMFVRDVSGHGYDLVAVSKKSSLRLVEGAVGKALAFQEPGYHVFVGNARTQWNVAGRDRSAQWRRSFGGTG